MLLKAKITTMPKLQKKYKAVIIGAGKIAAGFDAPRSREILTHAHAYSRHDKLKLSGFYDINFLVAKKAARKWSTQAFDNLTEMLTEVNPDIVSICTPDDDHFKTLMQVANFNPKLVVCEKPVTNNLADTGRLGKIFAKKNIPVLVNYSRRFDSNSQKIAAMIKNGKWGKVISATGIYTKGLLHTGSHLLDLTRLFFGEPLSVRSFNSIVDYHKDDPSISGYIEYERCPQFHLVIGNDLKYGIFELDIILEKGRLRITDYGFNVEMQERVEDKRYSGFFVLGKAKKYSTGLPFAMMNMVKNIVDFFEDRSLILCDIDEAAKTQALCEKLK